MARVISAAPARTREPLVEITATQHVEQMTADEAREFVDEITGAIRDVESTCDIGTCPSHPVAHGVCAHHLEF